MEQKKAETAKELQRWQIDRKYQRKLRSIEIRYERELKNEKIKEKNKVLKKENKPLKLVKNKVKSVNRVKKCDDIFSKYIRKKYWPRCYTCEIGEWTTNGHFITRMCRILRRDEDNCRPQCRSGCNCKTTGNWKPLEFAENLERDGIDTKYLVQCYHKRKKEPSKPTVDDMKKIYERYLKWYQELEW